MDEHAQELLHLDIGGYHIDQLLGSGGMATVLAAKNTLNPQIRRALKVIRPEYARERRFVDRFSREARLLEQLRSDHIVTFHGLRRDQGHLYMELELLEGCTLEELEQSVESAPQSISPLKRISLSHVIPQDSPDLPFTAPRTPLLITRWLYQAAKGLADAHKLNIVHRDLKPANIFICRDGSETGSIKILDFGVAKVLDELDGAQRHTLDGHVIGSPAFMAPEVCEGESPTTRADVYGLALIGYQLLLGRHPLIDTTRELNTMQVMLSHVNRELPSLKEVSGIPEGLAEVLRRASSRDPQRRFADGAAFAQELHAVLEVAEHGVHPIFQTQKHHFKSDDLSPESDPIYRELKSKQTERGLIFTGLVLALSAVTWWGLQSTLRGDQLVNGERGIPQYALDRAQRAQGSNPAHEIPKLEAPHVEEQVIAPSSSARQLAELNLEWRPLAGRDEGTRSLMRHEVTVAQYQACVRAGACLAADRPHKSPQRYGACLAAPERRSARVRHPVNCVSYQDAERFSRWVNSLYQQEKTRVRVDLPTRAEWLQAWGAGAHPWGDAPPSCDRAVHFAQAPACGGSLEPKETCSRAQEANGSPLCDLSGNVWEWVKLSSIGAKEASALIMGGGWSSAPSDLSRDRARSLPIETRAPHVGIRLVMHHNAHE